MFRYKKCENFIFIFRQVLSSKVGVVKPVPNGGKIRNAPFSKCRRNYQLPIKSAATNVQADNIHPYIMLRWGIETSFRDLKYAIGLVYFHARKLNSVLQEIHAALIMMNFCSLVISSIPLKQKSSWKYKHKINFAAAVGCCRSFFSSGKTKTLNPILRDQSLIRPDRHYDRNLHDTKPAKSMTYRVS